MILEAEPQMMLIHDYNLGPHLADGAVKADVFEAAAAGAHQERPDLVQHLSPSREDFR